MPITIAPNQIHIKKQDGSGFLPGNVVAGETTEQMCAAVEAAGQATIDHVNQAVADAQSAVNTLDAQKNSIAETVASMAQLGTDTSLATPGMAADAAKTGEEVGNLKSALLYNDELSSSGIYETTTFIQGQRSVATPQVVSSSSARCTSEMAYHLFPGDEFRVTNIKSGNKMWIGASNGFDSGWKTSDFSYMVVSECYAFIVEAKSDSTSAITPSDITTKITIIPAVIRSIKDRLLSIETGSVVFTKGDSMGYYNGTSVASSGAYSYKHIVNNGSILKLKFTILTASAAQAYVIKNGTQTSYQTVGSYDIDVSDASDIWINFFGATYCAGFELTTTKALDQNMFVKKTDYDAETEYLERVGAQTISKDNGKYNIAYSDETINNIICPYDVKKGYYVGTDGKEAVSSDWSVTYFIPVTSGESLYFGNTGLTCFYDANYDFISYRTGSYTAYTVPNNAEFMRVSILITALSNAAVNRGTTEKPYDDGIAHYRNNFKPYESGYVFFTVPVNQINWNRDANMGTERAKLDAEDWLDVNCYIKLPGTYTKDGMPTKLLMLCHGAGKGIKATDSDDNWCGYQYYDALVSAFISNGYAVFDCNGYANTRYACSFWGNRRGVQAWKNAYQYIIENYNVEHQFSIYAFSMGGLTAMAIASDLYPNIKCMALGSPVTSLKAMWDEGNNAVIADIYGMASSSVYDESKVLGCDPQKSIITIDNTDYFMKQLPPLKCWFGELETQPAPSDCLRMVNAIKNTNGIAQLRMVENATHSICFGVEPLITAEYVRWINRWNSIGRHN